MKTVNTALFSALTIIGMSLTGCSKPADTTPAKTTASATTTTSVATSATTDTTATPVTNASAGKTIKIATEGTYKPFSITNADGSLTGFDIELMRALCADMKANCDIKSQDWDGLFPGLAAKKYDVVIDAISMTPERKAQFDFTDAYFTNTLVFLTKKGSPINPDDAAQIDSHTVSAQRSTLSTQWMEKTHPKANLKTYESLDSAFLDLASGRADLMVSDKAPAYYWVNSATGQNFEVKGKEIDVNDNFGIVVRKGDPLREELNQALAHVKANGTYDKIFKSYFGDTSAPATTATTTTTANSATTTVTTTETKPKS